MMGVQILEGDWNVEMAGVVSGGHATTTTKNSSAKQRRWTAFRSWYRGGRVFDRADENLIAAAMRRRPPSPGSLGRPLTPRMTPADGPPPAAPSATQGKEGEAAVLPEAVGVKGEVKSEGGETVAASAVAAVAVPSDGVPTEVSDVAGGVVLGNEAGPVMFTEGALRGQRTEPPEPKATPDAGARVRAGAPAGATFHVTLLETDKLIPAQVGGRAGTTLTATADAHETDTCLPAAQHKGPHWEGGECGADIAHLSGIAAWDSEGEGEDEEDEENGGMMAKGKSASRLGLEGDACEVIAEGLPPISREDKTATAKQLRMEARRKFLAARTVNSKQAEVKVSTNSKSNSNSNE